MAGFIAGRFTDRREADRATAALRAAGFSPEGIGLIPEERENLGPPPVQSAMRSTIGAIIGALIGGTVGAIVGWLLSLAIAGHTAGWTVFWVSMAGGVIGWVVGGLVGSGKPLVRGEYRREAIQQGRTTLTVQADGREMEAKDILLRYGGSDVRAVQPGERGEYRAPPPDTTRGAPA